MVSISDLLQIGFGGGEGPAVFRLELSRDANDGVKETPLPDHIALRQPPDLHFPDQMHRLGTVDRPQRSLRRSEPQTRRDRFLINRWSCSMTLSE